MAFVFLIWMKPSKSVKKFATPILIFWGVVPSETVNLAKSMTSALTVASLAWLDQLLGQKQIFQD